MNQFCNECSNKGYHILPKSVFSRAEKCNCCKSCKQCRETGFTFKYDKIGREIAHHCSCKRLSRLIQLYNLAQIPSHYHDATFDQTKFSSNSKINIIIRKLKELVKTYSKGERKGILLYGEVGTGKTWLSSAILHQYIFQYGIKGQFVEFTKLLSQIKLGYELGKSESMLLGELNENEILVIDELGKGRQSDWENYILDAIIAQRYNTDKVTIFTSNYTDSKNTTYSEQFMKKKGGLDVQTVPLKHTLKERVNPRIYSRLQEMCVFQTMPSTDLRHPNQLEQEAKFSTEVEL